jgi:hypothetical protein
MIIAGGRAKENESWIILIILTANLGTFYNSKDQTLIKYI